MSWVAAAMSPGKAAATAPCGGLHVRMCFYVCESMDRREGRMFVTN